MPTDTGWKYIESKLEGAIAYTVDKSGMQQIHTAVPTFHGPSGNWICPEGKSLKLGLMQMAPGYEPSSSLEIRPEVQDLVGAVNPAQPVVAPNRGDHSVASLSEQHLNPTPTDPTQLGPNAQGRVQTVPAESDVAQPLPADAVVGVPPAPTPPTSTSVTQGPTIDALKATMEAVLELLDDLPESQVAVNVRELREKLEALG